MSAATPTGDSRVESDPVERARQYIAKHVAPRELELDGQHDPTDCFSWDLIEAADAYGLRALCVDPRYGGGGVDFLTFIRTAVELAKGDLGVAAMLVQVNRVAAMYESVGTPAQRERYLRDICSDSRCLLAFASTEEHLGSDSGMPITSGPNMTQYKTRAVRVSDGWEITGRKIYIDNGSTAKYYLVMAQTDFSAPISSGSTCFIVERGRPGLRSGSVFNKSGERLAQHAEVILEGCVVPDENIFGALNGASAQLALFSASRSMATAATAVGVAEAAYDCAVEWGRSRVQGGRRLIDHGAIRVDLARQRMTIDAATAYVEAAATAEMSGASYSKTFGIFPKIVAGEAAWGAAQLAVSLHGARGYTRGWRAEKLLRDAASFDHAGTPNRTALLKAARVMYGEQTLPS